MGNVSRRQVFEQSVLENHKELFLLTRQLPAYYKYKLLFETLLAFAFLALLSVPMLLVALCIKLRMGSPIFVKQLRVGRYGIPFYMYKFRTMYVGSATAKDMGFGAFNKPQNDPRIVGYLGYFLRKYKLDELPQIFNVLLGDMCLIGPRPYIYEETVLIPNSYYKRYLVRPGITGPWQVAFNTDLSIKEKLDSDEEYVGAMSFKRDLRLLFLTGIYVWLGENHSKNKHKDKDKSENENVYKLRAK